MTATQQQLQAVLDAAQTLLGHRQDCMDTVQEWAALARAVATCTGRKTADLLTPRDLEQVAEYRVAWDEAVDGPLPADEDGGD